MNSIKLFILIPILLILPSSNIQSAKPTRTELTDSIPEGAVPFEYENKLKKLILIPGTLNDSVLLRYVFDTGFSTMAFSDSLATDIERKRDKKRVNKLQKAMKIRIGGWERTSGNAIDAYYLDKKNPIFGFLGADVGIIPWQFFDKKIIEISFSKQYIRELSSTKDLFDYDSVKIVVKNGNLGIPVFVSVQGKKITEYLIIDTGCNNTIKFSNSILSKYGIKSEGAFFGEAHRVNRIQKEFYFMSDTIQVGKYFITQKNNVAFFPDKGPFPFSAGLLGTGILEKYDIVLDLKNYYLYLKPINK